MKTYNIAFDVDGTLRSNLTETTVVPNHSVVALFHILSTFKNVRLYVWSRGGKEYAESFAKRYNLKVPPSRCVSKIDAPHMDIAIDDQQEFSLADINLIVRQK